jgi:hypothetical protein
MIPNVHSGIMYFPIFPYIFLDLHLFLFSYAFLFVFLGFFGKKVEIWLTHSQNLSMTLSGDSKNLKIPVWIQTGLYSVSLSYLMCGFNHTCMYSSSEISLSYGFTLFKPNFLHASSKSMGCQIGAVVRSMFEINISAGHLWGRGFDSQSSPFLMC